MASALSTLTLHGIERVAMQGSGILDYACNVSNLQEDATLDASDFRMYPALWNAHEHLDFNLFPRLGNPPYANAYEWGLEITQGRRNPVIDKVLRVPQRVRVLAQHVRG